jgi:O-antigen/teichoic acid export membrane protein
MSGMSDPAAAPPAASEPTPWASSHGRRTASGIFWVFLGDALILPTGLVTAAFLTRRLGPDGYGLFTLATVLVFWGEYCLASIFSRATIRFVGAARDWRAIGATVGRSHLLAGVLLTLAFIAAAQPVGTLLDEPRLAGFLALAALDIPLFSFCQAHINVLVGLGGFRIRALAPVGRWLGRLFLVLALVGGGLAVPGAIAANIGASAIELAIYRRRLRLPIWRRSDFPARRLFGLAVPLFVFALSVRIYDRLDLLMLKGLGGTASQVGFYGAAQNLSLVPLIFAGVVSTLLLSTLTRLVREGQEAAARRMARDGLRAAIALIPFAAIAAGASDEIVAAIFGPSFVESGPLLALLIFAEVGLATMSIAHAVLTAAERPMRSVYNVVPLLPLVVVAHWIVIPRAGAIGAAAVTTAFATIGAGVAAVLVGRTWGAFPPWATWARSAVLSGVAFAAASHWPAPGLWLAPKLAVVSLVVVGGFVALGELDAAERRLLDEWVLDRLWRR